MPSLRRIPTRSLKHCLTCLSRHTMPSLRQEAGSKISLVYKPNSLRAREALVARSERHEIIKVEEWAVGCTDCSRAARAIPFASGVVM